MALVWGEGSDGFPPHHAYVRRFWSAVMGPAAVADLLRLIAAALRSSSIPRPERLHLLTVHNLVRPTAGAILVRATVPALDQAELRLVSPQLRSEHLREVRRYFGGSPR